MINTLKQLLKRFPNEKSCIEYLEVLRWGNTPFCPRCNSPKPYKTNEGWKCSNKECYKKFNIKTGTIFQNTRVPLDDWFIAIYYVLREKNKGISSVSLAKEIEVTQKTAWYMLQKIRIMIGNRGKDILGSNNYVEADELYYGGIARYKHHLDKQNGTTGLTRRGKPFLENSIILGLIERGGKVVLRIVNNTKKKTMHKFIDNHLIRGSTIYTDGHRGYWGLKKRYFHKVVKHSQGIYVRGIVHTNTIENVWSHLQTGMKAIYKRPKDKYMQRYLDEFSEKFNTRNMIMMDRIEMFLGRCKCYLSHTDLVA